MGTLNEEFTHLWQYIAEFCLEWENENTHFVFIKLFSKIVPFMR
jgi:hypothetical protein